MGGLGGSRTNGRTRIDHARADRAARRLLVCGELELSAVSPIIPRMEPTNCVDWKHCNYRLLLKLHYAYTDGDDDDGDDDDVDRLSSMGNRSLFCTRAMKGFLAKRFRSEWDVFKRQLVGCSREEEGPFIPGREVSGGCVRSHFLCESAPWRRNLSIRFQLVGLEIFQRW